jgi:membrane protease YdiL (CAAX protease family)
MREHERRGRLFGPPAGHPRSGAAGGLLEAAGVLAAFYATALIPLAGGSGGIASPLFHAELVGIDALRIALVLLVMGRAEGLAAFGLGRIRAADPLRALLSAAGAFAVALAPSPIFRLLGLENPLMAGLPSATPWSLAPLFLASSMATGYAEELVFRVYLMRRLEGAGLPALWAAVASSLLFGASHGAQGIVGIAATTLIGLWFAWRWRDGRNAHEIAIGHGLYDAAVLAIALYARA